MKLSSIPNSLGHKIIRNGAFRALGKINHSKSGLLVFVESADYIHSLSSNKNITAVICTDGLASDIPRSLSLVTSRDPRLLFYDLHEYLFSDTDFYGEDCQTKIHDTAKVHPSACVATRGVVIGENTVIEAGVVLHQGTVIESSVIVRSGAVIGAEGFEFFKKADVLNAVTHAGGVLLKKNSEVQSGTVIEKAVYGGNTVIGANTKIGSNALIAHNTSIGDSCLLAGGVTVSGNVIIENGVWIGPSATISNGITIQRNARVSLGAIVVRTVKQDKSVSGIFATDKHRVFKFMSRSGLIT